jgi:hypothetical protein
MPGGFSGQSSMWSNGANGRFGNTPSMFGSNGAAGTNGMFNSTGTGSNAPWGGSPLQTTPLGTQGYNGAYYGNPNGFYSGNAAQAFNGYANSLGYYPTNGSGYPVTPPGYNRPTTYYGSLNAAPPGDVAPMNNAAGYPNGNVAPGYTGYSPYYGNNAGYGMNASGNNVPLNYGTGYVPQNYGYGIGQYPQTGSAMGNMGSPNPGASGGYPATETAPAAGGFGWF